MAVSKTDFDSPWKEALEQYFPAFMQLLSSAGLQIRHIAT